MLVEQEKMVLVATDIEIETQNGEVEVLKLPNNLIIGSFNAFDFNTVEESESYCEDLLGNFMDANLNVVCVISNVMKLDEYIKDLH